VTSAKNLVLQEILAMLQPLLVQKIRLEKSAATVLSILVTMDLSALLTNVISKLENASIPTTIVLENNAITTYNAFNGLLILNSTNNAKPLTAILLCRAALSLINLIHCTAQNLIQCALLAKLKMHVKLHSAFSIATINQVVSQLLRPATTTILALLIPAIQIPVNVFILSLKAINAWNASMIKNAQHGEKLWILLLFAKLQFVNQNLATVLYLLLQNLVISAIPVLQLNVKSLLALAMFKEYKLAFANLWFVMIMTFAPLTLVTKLPENASLLKLTLLYATHANLTLIARVGAILKILMHLARKASVMTKENVILVQPAPRKNANPSNVPIALLSLLVIKSIVLWKMESLLASTPKLFAKMEFHALRTIATHVMDNVLTIQFPPKNAKSARPQQIVILGQNNKISLQNVKRLSVKTTSVIPDQQKMLAHVSHLFAWTALLLLVKQLIAYLVQTILHLVSIPTLLAMITTNALLTIAIFQLETASTPSNKPLNANLANLPWTAANMQLTIISKQIVLFLFVLALVIVILNLLLIPALAKENAPKTLTVCCGQPITISQINASLHTVMQELANLSQSMISQNVFLLLAEIAMLDHVKLQLANKLMVYISAITKRLNVMMELIAPEIIVTLKPMHVRTILLSANYVYWILTVPLFGQKLITSMNANAQYVMQKQKFALHKPFLIKFVDLGANNNVLQLTSAILQLATTIARTTLFVTFQYLLTAMITILAPKTRAIQRLVVSINSKLPWLA
jgi:hypothetical protein